MRHKLKVSLSPPSPIPSLAYLSLSTVSLSLYLSLSHTHTHTVSYPHKRALSTIVVSPAHLVCVCLRQRWAVGSKGLFLRKKAVAGCQRHQVPPPPLAPPPRTHLDSLMLLAWLCQASDAAAAADVISAVASLALKQRHCSMMRCKDVRGGEGGWADGVRRVVSAVGTSRGAVERGGGGHQLGSAEAGEPRYREGAAPT
eukprot:1868402-Rhodomonas_salina.2